MIDPRAAPRRFSARLALNELVVRHALGLEGGGGVHLLGEHDGASKRRR